MNNSEALLQLADSMTQVIEVVVGYRAKLETQGFSPAASEEMALDFHRALIAAVMSAKKS